MIVDCINLEMENLEIFMYWYSPYDIKYNSLDYSKWDDSKGYISNVQYFLEVENNPHEKKRNWYR